MENKMNYYLYRSLYDIIHPSISRKNISNYKIVIDDNLVPLQIYYPGKNVMPEKVIIYIPNMITDNNVYKELAEKTETLILVIECHDSERCNECYDVINYVYNNIDNTGIEKNNIIVMTDYDGCEVEEKIIDKISVTKDFSINKSILIDPTIYNNDLCHDKNTLVIIGDESICENNENYKYVKHYLGEFIQGKNIAVKEHVYSVINQFIN